MPTMPEVTMDPIYVAELELESEALNIGEVRYQRLRTKAEDRTKAGQRFLRDAVPKGAVAIQTYLDDSLAGKPGPGAGVAKFISMFPPDTVSFLVCRSALCSHGATPTALAVEITKTLERIQESDELKKTDPKGFKRLQTKVEKAPTPGKRYVLTKKALVASKVERINWGSEIRAKVGHTLLRLVADATEVFTIDKYWNGKKWIPGVYITEQSLASLEAGHAHWAGLSPMYIPMVIKPRQWTNPFNGGYINRKTMKRDMITSKHLNPNYLEELKNTEMPTVYAAINALQETEWCINARVFKVAATLRERGQFIAGLPGEEPKPLPERLPDDQKAALSKEGWEAYNAKLAEIHAWNREAVGHRVKLAQQMWIAERFLKFDAIYFPHVLDWRGRMYPIPTLVTPQENDLGKSLLEFANGSALGEQGAYWLAVHGANTFGIDKLPFDDRKEWVVTNEQQILLAASDPLANLWWADADSPFQFLAFCFDWSDFVAHKGSGGDPTKYVSSLPCGWDGSCNGLQNFSAMLRDPIGGESTNLIPSDRPRDIYAKVAETASVIVAKDAASGEVNANYWLGKVDRQMAKRPTMTLPYGATKYGFKDQLRTELKDRKHKAGGKPYILGDEFLCAKYLGTVMEQALAQVVVKAREAMEWLQEVAAIASSEGLPVHWYTPSGLYVWQEYTRNDSKRIDMVVCGQRITFVLSMRGDKINAQKQAQSIAPNFVHSLDAAHLQRTVERCHAEGIRSFAMIHDSYGTTAGNATALHAILRETFVEQYSGNVLADFRATIADQLSPSVAVKLPPVPAMGTLDLEQVKSSRYFFA
jgi:DNA-directed RNA polymerase, mitochondrial